MPNIDYTRILRLITKRLHDTITPTEFEELNKWIYGDTGSNREIYEILTTPGYGDALKEIANSLEQMSP